MLIAFILLFILLVCIAETAAAVHFVVYLGEEWGNKWAVPALALLMSGTCGVWIGAYHVINMILSQ